MVDDVRCAKRMAEPVLIACEGVTRKTDRALPVFGYDTLEFGGNFV